MKRRERRIEEKEEFTAGFTQKTTFNNNKTSIVSCKQMLSVWENVENRTLDSTKKMASWVARVFECWTELKVIARTKSKPA